MHTGLARERPRLSVVIPLYNEARRLEEPLRSISEYLSRRDYSVEIVVADDGSHDGTFDLIQSVGAGLSVPIHALRYERNRGKGHALKVGFAHTRGEFILFTDIDLATPIEELNAFDAAMDSGCDIVIGSRKMAGANVTVRQPWYREQMGMVFTGLVRTYLADVSDATCGFKMFRGDIGRDLFAHLRIHDWAFDAELLFLAERRGHSIQEVPVRWEDQAGTKVRLLRDAWSSMLGLIRIVRNNRTGLYERRSESDSNLEIWSNEFDGLESSAGSTNVSRS